MSIPKVTISFADGGLGIIPPGPGGAQAKVGVSLSGTVNTVYPIASGAGAVLTATIVAAATAIAASPSRFVCMTFLQK